MKLYIKKLFKIYKYTALVFSVGFWIYMIIDDYVFIEKYWTEMWAAYIGMWFLWYLVYLLMFSNVFWVIGLCSVFIYDKLIKKKAVVN